MLEILARSHAFLDRFRSKQFCGFLLLWANDWSEEVFVFIYLSPAVFFLFLCVAMQMFSIFSPLGYTQGQKGATLTFYMFH